MELFKVEDGYKTCAFKGLTLVRFNSVLRMYMDFFFLAWVNKTVTFPLFPF